MCLIIALEREGWEKCRKKKREEEKREDVEKEKKGKKGRKERTEKKERKTEQGESCLETRCPQYSVKTRGMEQNYAAGAGRLEY